MAPSSNSLKCRPESVETKEVVLPTQGLITVVKEVQTDLFKIEEEVTIPDTAGSLIVANYLDQTSDTFTFVWNNSKEVGTSSLRSKPVHYFWGWRTFS